LLAEIFKQPSSVFKTSNNQSLSHASGTFLLLWHATCWNTFIGIDSIMKA